VARGEQSYAVNRLVDIYYQDHHVNDLSPCGREKRARVRERRSAPVAFHSSQQTTAVSGALTSDYGFDEGAVPRAVHKGVLDRIKIVGCSRSETVSGFHVACRRVAALYNSSSRGHLLGENPGPGR